MPEIPTQPQTTSNQKSINWKSVLLLVVIVTVVIGLGVWIFLILQPKPTQITTNNATSFPPIATQSVKKGETADWKIYTNKVYSFEVKYPTTWNLDYYPSIDPPGEATTILFDKFLPEELVSSEWVTVGILVSANEDALPLRDFIIEDGGIDYPLILEFTNQKSRLDYNREKVREMQETTFQEFFALQYGENRLFVEAGKTVFVFYINSLAGVSVEDRKIFIQILSTFKLLD